MCFWRAFFIAKVQRGYSSVRQSGGDVCEPTGRSLMGYQQGDPIFEAYITETGKLVQQLEEMILASEHARQFPEEMMQEIFRIMHTVKGSSSMMQFHNIAVLAHALEDLFTELREHSVPDVKWEEICDLMLEGVDFIRVELHKLRSGESADGDPALLTRKVEQLLAKPEQGPSPSGSSPSGNSWSGANAGHANHVNLFEARILFTDDCEMENIRAFQIVHHLEGHLKEYRHIPEDLLEDPEAVQTIRNHGFQLFMATDKSYDEIYSLLFRTSYLKDLELRVVMPADGIQESTLKAAELPRHQEEKKQAQTQAQGARAPQLMPAPENKQADRMQANEEKEAELTQAHEKSIGPASNEVKVSAGSYIGESIQVNVNKLDELMDLVGELVIAEAMVTQNPDIAALQLDQFQKAARQLQKITREIQDKVMEIRMVPLATTFQRMHRIVRDMSKNLGKSVRLQLIGEETEIDKTVIEHITDPLMHLVRNAVDHGLESAAERAEAGKPETGTVTLEALNNGSEVLIMVRDDGRGLNKQRILEIARDRQLLYKPEPEMTDKEIFQLIFLPGFSTKEEITEYSGRGVGMDVVMQNVASVGGSIIVDSRLGAGTIFTIKIPLTLAIIDGMNVRVGEAQYTLPTASVKESFRPQAKDVITDPDGHEMIMVRGECCPIVRIHELFRVQPDHAQIHEGILILAEHDGRGFCIFVDDLVGQQQVVVKALPPYLRRFNRVEGISGCTLLGDGSISLILDMQGLLKMTQKGAEEHVTGRYG
jgi:two-component system chemotaxis sensor kinase CheA